MNDVIGGEEEDRVGNFARLRPAAEQVVVRPLGAQLGLGDAAGGGAIDVVRRDRAARTEDVDADAVGASSTASAREKPSTAALVVSYCPMPARPITP